MVIDLEKPVSRILINSEELKIESSSDVSDLDYIKYQDTLLQFETGKVPPTDEEYEQILEEGYKILDNIFRGEIT